MSSRLASDGSKAMSKVPVSLRRPPPCWPGRMPRNRSIRVRHWSARALRSTRIRVEVPRSAITAQPMTVLPDPGGATSSPSSWARRAPTAALC